MNEHFLQELRDQYHILTGNFAPSSWHKDITRFIAEIEKEKIKLIEQIEAGEVPQQPEPPKDFGD